MINTSEIAKGYRLSHWAQIMQERVASGLNIKEFCKHIGICGNTYFYWQRRLRAAACEHLAELAPARKSLAQPRFTEVKVAEPPAPLAYSESIQPSQIRIDLHGIQITLDSTYPPDKLAILIREFMRPC